MGKGRSYMNSYADGYMRGKVVKEVGALLDNITSGGNHNPHNHKIGVWTFLRYH